MKCCKCKDDQEELWSSIKIEYDKWYCVECFKKVLHKLGITETKEGDDAGKINQSL